MRAVLTLAVTHGSCTGNVMTSVLMVHVMPSSTVLATSTIGQSPTAARELALSDRLPVVFLPVSVRVLAETPAGSARARTRTVPVKPLSRVTVMGRTIEPLRTIGTRGCLVATSNGTALVTTMGSARATRDS